MGSDKYTAEKPVQKIFLDRYYIDKFLVTNAQFQTFVGETGYQTDAEKEGAGMVRIGRRWKKVPEALHLKAFGPRATSPELNRMHEEQGVQIAGDILSKVHYDQDKVSEILKIIDGHDSRKKAVSFNDQIVKDADKLFRYSQKGFEIDNKRFEETVVEGLSRLRTYVDRWFFTQTAYRIAKDELAKREKEAGR